LFGERYKSESDITLSSSKKNIFLSQPFLVRWSLYIKTPIVISDILISSCRKMNRDSQRQLYEIMAPKLYRTCRRYLKKEEDIEEALADSFYTIFTKIGQVRDNGSFEAWARRVTVNHCLRSIKKNVNFNMYIDDAGPAVTPVAEINTDLEEADLLKLLTLIPEGCRTVFNLYVIEGFSHKEIAGMLAVTEGTSKSQLNAAKTKLKGLIHTYYKQAR
jgi:RNA polymerase sigma factor (sigma-70 family)